MREEEIKFARLKTKKGIFGKKKNKKGTKHALVKSVG